MADFLSEYESSTNTIDNIVSSQLSSVLNWVNIPGAMTKVSASASGFVWGFNSSNQIYVCQMPCTGSWIQVDISKYSIGTIIDITTDLTNVYVLGTGNMLIAPATNQGVWNMIPVPFSATAIFSTHSYIWAQDGANNKQKCPKPCMSSNWIASPEKDVTITSSSDTSLYGKTSTGSAVKTDENIQSGWSPIDGLADVKISSLNGNVDNSALYGVDQSSNLFKFDGTTHPVATQGYAPINLSIEPQTKQMWMTTSTAGDKGNIFNRLENPDYTTITNAIAPLDKSRDEVVDDVQKAYSNQTTLMVINKQITDVVNYFKNMFKIDRNTAKQGDSQSKHIQDQIKDTQSQLDQINFIQPIIQQLIILLFLVLLAYFMLSSILGSLVNIIVILGLVIGVYYIMNFSGSNSNGESTFSSFSSSTSSNSDIHTTITPAM